MSAWSWSLETAVSAAAIVVAQISNFNFAKLNDFRGRRSEINRHCASMKPSQFLHNTPQLTTPHSLQFSAIWDAFVVLAGGGSMAVADGRKTPHSMNCALVKRSHRRRRRACNANELNASECR